MKTFGKDYKRTYENKARRYFFWYRYFQPGIWGGALNSRYPKRRGGQKSGPFSWDDMEVYDLPKRVVVGKK
jgi:hypothetical protein